MYRTSLVSDTNFFHAIAPPSRQSLERSGAVIEKPQSFRHFFHKPGSESSLLVFYDRRQG
jgi:hypothetical protein